MVRIFVALLLLSLTESAFALRCGNKLITEGDYIEEVRVRCGDPIAIDTYTILREQRITYSGHYRLTKEKYTRLNNRLDYPVVTQSGLIEIFVEKWLYNFGPHRLIRSLHFENGILRDIEHFGYGYISNS